MMKPDEIRYLHNTKIVRLSYPDTQFELKIHDLYNKLSKSDTVKIYLEYIQESDTEVAFGFSDGNSYSIPFDSLYSLAMDISRGLKANGMV